jgi:hypothetical protein
LSLFLKLNCCCWVFSDCLLFVNQQKTHFNWNRKQYSGSYFSLGAGPTPTICQDHNMPVFFWIG